MGTVAVPYPLASGTTVYVGQPKKLTLPQFLCPPPALLSQPPGVETEDL